MGDVPTLAEEDSDEEPDEEPDAGTAGDLAAEVDDEQDDDGPTEVDEVEIDLSEDDLGGDLFSGVEDSDPGDGGGDPDADQGDGVQGDGEQDDGDGEETVADGLDGNAAAMEGAINDGLGRALVFGLTEEDFEESDWTKDGLHEEFTETAEAFRVGYFGSQVVEKYVLEPADGDVNPAWGLAGSMLMMLGMAVWMRPDGDEAVAKAREAVENLGGGA